MIWVLTVWLIILTIGCVVHVIRAPKGQLSVFDKQVRDEVWTLAGELAAHKQKVDYLLADSLNEAMVEEISPEDVWAFLNSDMDDPA